MVLTVVFYRLLTYVKVILCLAEGPFRARFVVWIL